MFDAATLIGAIFDTHGVLRPEVNGATGRPYDNSTPTCLRFTTISSGQCFFCGILASSKG